MKRKMRVFRMISDFTISAGTPGVEQPPFHRTTNEPTVSWLIALDKDHTAELTMFLEDALKLGLIEEDI